MNSPSWGASQGIKCFPSSPRWAPPPSSSLSPFLPFQDSFRKRSLRRSSSLSRKLQAPEECQQPSESLVQTPACPGPQEVPSSSSDSVSRSPLGQLNELPMEKPNASPSSQGPSQRDRARLRRVSEDGLLGSSHTETSTTSLKLYLPGGNSRVTQERPERAFKRQGSQPPSLRWVCRPKVPAFPNQAPPGTHGPASCGFHGALLVSGALTASLGGRQGQRVVINQEKKLTRKTNGARGQAFWCSGGGLLCPSHCLSCRRL